MRANGGWIQPIKTVRPHDIICQASARDIGNAWSKKNRNYPGFFYGFGSDTSSETITAYRRSMMVAVAMPWAMHMVCRP